MGRTFSVDLDDKTMNSLTELMDKWPTKSRNGIIRHIINTYGIDGAQRDSNIERLLERVKNLENIIQEDGGDIWKHHR